MIKTLARAESSAFAELQARLSVRGAYLGSVVNDVAVAIPTNATELEEILGDDTRLKAIYNGGGLGEFIKNYVTASAEKDSTIVAQVREETQRTLAQWLKDQREAGADTPVDLTNPADVKALNKHLLNGNRNKGQMHNPAAPGAGLDKVFASAAEFFQGAYHQRHTLSNAAELAPKMAEVQRIQNSFSSVVPADGGFLIPETLRSEILQVALESAIVRPRATVIPMSSLRLPMPTLDDTSHVGSVLGGIVAYWTEEGAALIESQAKFGRVVLEAKKLTCYTEPPSELVADAPGFGAFLDQALPEAVAYFEDVACFKGSGVGEPLGWLNGTAAVTVARSGGASTITWPDVIKIYSRMLPTSLNRAVWTIAPDALPQLLGMTFATGAPVAVWLPGGAGFEAPQLTLLGRPVIITEKNPALGATGDLSFVDLGYYLFGDRQAMQANSSTHYRFGQDKIAYRIIERVDGRPWLNDPITPQNGSANTLSPIVKLT